MTQTAAQKKARYDADPEKYRALARARWAANPEKCRARKKELRAADPEKYRARVKAWATANPERLRAYRHERRDRLRAICLNHYSGGTLACSCCGERTNEFLTMDHVNGRKAHGHAKTFGGVHLHMWLINNGFPPGFDVLCMNCNLAKGIYGQCPHQTLGVPAEKLDALWAGTVKRVKP